MLLRGPWAMRHGPFRALAKQPGSRHCLPESGIALSIWPWPRHEYPEANPGPPPAPPRPSPPG